MRRRLLLLTCSVVVVGVAAVAVQSEPKPTLYHGARLILGSESAPIENGAFVVQGGAITAVGVAGQVRLPAGGVRVDLTGKTVMPALVNAHIHIGYERFATARGESLAENFTKENMLDHLRRQAYYGVGVAGDGGSAALDIAAEFLKDQAAGKFPTAARFSLTGGVVPIKGGPDGILIRGTRPLQANYEVTRSPEARKAVQAIAARNIKHLKVWIGDRGGSYPAMPKEIYEAVIDEAHKHGIKVHAHIGSTSDQKDVLRAGADVIVHARTDDYDDELVALVREKRPYWIPVIGLGDRSRVCDNDPFFSQTLSLATVTDIQSSNCKDDAAAAAAREAGLKRAFSRMLGAGARLVLGTDAGVFPRYAFGSADHHELSFYVRLGVSPAEALVAATSRAAEALGMPDVGTLAAGKRADFLVLEANPLDDITNTRRIADVYLRGVRINRPALLAQWQGQAAATR